MPGAGIGLQWMVLSTLFRNLERWRGLSRAVKRDHYREGLQFQAMLAALRRRRYLSGWPALRQWWQL
jgi:hypothetical protein